MRAGGVKNLNGGLKRMETRGEGKRLKLEMTKMMKDQEELQKKKNYPRKKIGA